MFPSRWRLRQALAHQALNVTNLLAGRTVSPTPLGSMTLDEDDVAVARNWLSHRDRWGDDATVQAYEAAFAHWNGSRHAFAFMGGRVALSACIYALDLQPGDEVILPGYTCVVVPNAFHYAGVTTVYADIELDTYGLDAAAIERQISHRTRAIVVHHLYGLVSRDLEELLAIARRHSLRVIEDCAHATGASYRTRKVGNFGDVAFYSSEQSKVFTTIEGGVATTNANELAARLATYQQSAKQPSAARIDRLLHTVFLNYYRFKHSQRWWRGDLARLRFGDKEVISTTPEELEGTQPPNYHARMPAPVAALGLNQLRKVDHYNAARRHAAARWTQWSVSHGYTPPTVIDGSVPVFLRYPILVEPQKKVDTLWAEDQLGVKLGVWFTSHTHPARWTIDGCPQAAVAVERCINFPTIL